MESRTPPHNLDAEKSVLGSILLDNEVFAALEGTLVADHFYKEGHRKIFRGMERLYRRNEPMDLVTLTEELRQSGDLEGVGSVPYLIGLADSVPTAAYADSYAKIVLEKAVLRDLINVSGRIMQSAYEGAAPLEQVLDQAEASVFELSTSKRRSFFEGMPQLVQETFQHINELFTNPDPVSGMRTGFKELDGMTAGLQPSSLNVLAARPSMGKTAFALTIALNAALREKQSVGVFSLEMSGVQLVTRMLCSEARVDMSRVRTGQLTDRDFQRLADTAGRMSEAKIFIDDNADLSVMELRARARRLMAEHDLGLVVVDYLQLMSGSTNRYSENRQQEISTISRGMKALARELDIPILVLSQLSRAVEARPNKRPMLSDLRECVTGDTLVVLADGRRIPIRELVGTTPEVVAVGADGRLVTARSDKVWHVGRRPVFEVRLASGRTIKATGRHRLLGEDGWKRVDDLAVGDRLALARYLPEPRETASWPDEHVMLLGQLIGDGSYLKGQPMRYTTSSEDNSRVVREVAERSFGATVTRFRGRGSWHQLLISGNGDRWRPAGVNAWLRELGIFGQRSFEKRIPTEAFRLPNRQIALLLQHLWATDGCIHVDRSARRPRGRVSYATDSRELAFDVAALLLRLGIVARLHSIQKDHHRPGYQVHVSGATHQRRFLEAVGGFGAKRAAAVELQALLAGIRANTNVDTLPKGILRGIHATMERRGVSTLDMARLRGVPHTGLHPRTSFEPSRQLVVEDASHLDDPYLHVRATDDLMWDTVTGVVVLGEDDVYDLTVPGPSSWIADSCASHNSGAIEQDADLVMFIYRDEYYDPNSEKQGIAEIIIGKQRNGPVGSLDLQFHNAHVRFNDLARSTTT